MRNGGVTSGGMSCWTIHPIPTMASNDAAVSRAQRRVRRRFGFTFGAGCGSGADSAGGETLSLKQGDSVLLPSAVTQWELSTPEGLALLRVTVPDTP